MSTTPLRFPTELRPSQQLIPPPDQRRQAATPILIVLLLAGAMILLGAFLSPLVRGGPDQIQRPAAIQEETIGAQRVTIREFPDRPWLSFYRANADRLGEPRWSERPYDIYASCMGFTNYVICHNPDPSMRGTTWEFLPQLLGSKNLPPGVLPDPHAQLALIVQAFLIHLESQGVDHWYWLGAVQSPAFCPQGSGECFQVFQSQVLRWPATARADDPSAVRISPLGLTVNKTS